MPPVAHTTYRYVFLILLGLFANIASFSLFLYLSHGPTAVPEHYPVLQSDSSVYAALADNLLFHHVFSDSNNLEPFRKWAIGYPLFLAASKLISGGFLLAVALQVTLSLFSATLLFRMARNFLPEQFALIPALLYVCDPYLLFLNTSVLTDGLFTSLLVILVYGIFFWEKKRELWKFFGLGALLGIAVLVRPIGQFLIVLLPLLYFFYTKVSLRRMACLAGVFFVGFSLIIGPWVIRNAVVFGTPEIAHISSFDLLYYNAQSFLLLKTLRAERPQPILLSSAPTYTPEAVSAAKEVETRIKTDLARSTPPGQDPSNHEGALALRYIFADPLYYAYFHVANMASFFLEGNIRGYTTEVRATANYHGYDIPVPTLFSSWRELRSPSASLSQRMNNASVLAFPLIEIVWRATLVVCALAALLFARGERQRLLVVLAALITYFALLTGPVGLGTARLHIPAEPYLLLLATAGVACLVPIGAQLWHNRREFSRFLLSGGTATVVDLVLLYVGVEFFKIPYLISASLALVVAYNLSFFLQKYWAFKDKAREKVRTQALLFVAIVACNIVLNDIALWFLVHELFVWYLAAQFAVAVGIALFSYVVYKKFIFGRKMPDSATSPEGAI